MPIAPFLALGNRGAGTPQLKRYLNATPAIVGSTFGVPDTSAVGLNVNRGYPAVIKFGGSRTFLATVGLDIYRSTNGGASWSSVFTFVSGTHLHPSSTASKSGLFVLHVGGAATACIVTQHHTTSDWWAFTSADGTTWATHGPFSGPNSSYNDPHDSVVWSGRLVSMWGRGADANVVSTVFDPSTLSMTFASMATIGPGNVVNDIPLCVYRDRLFALNHESSGSRLVRLEELSFGSWIPVEAAWDGCSTTNEGKNCLFTDGTFMYVFMQRLGSWMCHYWDSLLTRTDITAITVPTALASGMLNTARMSVVADSRTLMGIPPRFWLHQSVDGAPGSMLNQWAWNTLGAFIGASPGSPASIPDDSGGSARDNLPFVAHAQGTTFWTSGEEHVEQVGMAPAPGGITVSFRLYSDFGVGTTNVRAWRGVALQTTPINAATLTGPTLGLAKDNTTIHQVVWEAVIDGFTAGQRAKFVLELF